MPDTRTHRGPDPADEHLFCDATLGDLRQATADLSWLLSHGYAIRSAVELVGNRYSLAARQRLAVARSACAAESAQARGVREVPVTACQGQQLWIDGLNVLTGLEVALAGGVILLGCDGCCRDVAGVHRQYRKVEETLPALHLLGECGVRWGVRKCHWWLDKPVSNSGRLKSVILELAAAQSWDWRVDLVYNPDDILSKTEHIIASADSIILDRCAQWLNLVRHVIGSEIPGAHVLDLCPERPSNSLPLAPHHGEGVGLDRGGG